VQNDHANMVAGIIQMGDAALGRGQLHSVSLANFLRNTSQIGGSAQLFDESMELFSYTLQEIRPGGKLPNVRVINYSAAAGGVSQPDGTLRKNATGQDLWWLARPAPTCGGAMCTPNNDDEWQREFGAVGRHAERIADVAATKKVLIVQAAANDGFAFCTLPNHTGCTGSPYTFERIHAHNVAEFAWAARNKAGLPVLIVEALGGNGTTRPAQSLDMFVGSNDRGDISAPGASIGSTARSGFDTTFGTSIAAPHVTGVAGFLLALNPSLSPEGVRNTILATARTDTLGGATPRLDAYSAVADGLGTGAVLDWRRAMVDVNDMSADGNRRVELNRGDVEGANDLTGSAVQDPLTKEPYRTDGHGEIDMRDFRRFRDAWLQVCTDMGAAGETLPAGCPLSADIKLNGPSTHAKKDLNFDGCVFVSVLPPGDNDPQRCQTRETYYPRFDFNADGSLTSGDLEALKALFGTSPSGPADTEGRTTTELDQLMISGDLEIHAEGMFSEPGVTEVDLTIRSDSGDIKTRKLAPGAGFLIATTQVSSTGSTVEVSASATGADGPVQALPKQVALAPGQDRRIDLCHAGLILEADKRQMQADGDSFATLTATLYTCEGDETIITNQAINFELTPAVGAGTARLTKIQATTNQRGFATTSLISGTTAQDDLQVRAIATIGTRTFSSTLSFKTTAKLTIAYAWKQETLDWRSSGSTHWPLGESRPDCDATPRIVWYCIDASTVELDPARNTATLTRSGTLTGQGPKVFVSEQAGTDPSYSMLSWTVSSVREDGVDVLGCSPKTAYMRSRWQVRPSDADHYQNHDMQGKVTIEDTERELRLNGLWNVGELGYVNDLVPDPLPGDPTLALCHYAGPFGNPMDLTVPPALGSVTLDVALVPRGNGAGITYSRDLAKPIIFPRNPDGTFAPYTFCGTFEKDLTTTPGYRLPTADPYFPGADASERKETWSAGDHPLPVGPGTLRVRYRFAAVATYSTTPPLAVLPDTCDETPKPPVVDFLASPLISNEGRVVEFLDLSSPSGDIVTWNWDFGEAPSPRPQPCDPTGFKTCHIFADNGTYNVTLTVTTAAGLSASKTQEITVRNLPPTAQIDSVSVPVNQPIVLPVRIWDPGWIDLPSVTYRLTSSNTAFPVLQGTWPDHVTSLAVPGSLPVGSYRLTLEATDKDGARALAYATLTIVPDGQTVPQAPVLGPIGTCDPTVELDGEEQRFLSLLNQYRRQNGVQPVDASPKLTKAADVHARDMAINNFMAHTGSDGSSPFDRAIRQGYDGVVGENVLRGTGRGTEAITGWKSSTTGHNENLVRPNWKAIGISREQNPNTGEWFWATSFGDVLDCPLTVADTQLGKAGRLRPLGLDKLASPLGIDAAAAGPLALDAAAAGPLALDAAAAGPLGADAGAPLAVASAQQTSSDPPVPALAVIPARAQAFEATTFVNRSRNASGQPIGATIDFGNGQTGTLAPDGALQHTYTAGGTVSVTLTTTAQTDNRSVTRQVVVEALPPDFTIVTSPTSQVLAPGNTSGFVVTLGSVRGFNQPVTLSVSGLPAGVTGSFSPTIVTPSGISTLTLSASTSASIGTATLTITGMSGSLSHSTASTLQVDFGLVPVCKGALTGRVTETGTGRALLGVPIGGAATQVATDEQGRFALSDLSLGPNNAPSIFFVAAGQTATHHSANTFTTISCGGVPHVELQMEPRRWGTLSGAVHIGEPDPSNLTTSRAVTDTGTPLPNANVRVTTDSFVGADATTGQDGTWRTGQVELSKGLLQEGAGTQFHASNYWQFFRRTTLAAGQDVAQPTVALVRKCTATLSGKVILGDTSAPVSGLNVFAGANWDIPASAGGGSDGAGYVLTTDSQGNYSVTTASLAYNNASAMYRVQANGPIPTGYTFPPAITNISVPTCGSNVQAPDLVLPRAAGPNYGATQGHVYDRETGLPLAGVNMTFAGSTGTFTATTDAHGFYSMPQVLAGTGSQMQVQGSLYALKDEY